jgi:hypothetical protein
MAQGPAEEFVTRLRSAPIRLDETARFLDKLTHGERVEAIRAVGRKEQARLYEAAKGFAPVRNADLVPPDKADFETVRHFGKNTLPAFTHFEKRFCRPAGQDPEKPDALHGFNFQTMAPVTGPGYFVAVPDEARGEVLVDYRQVPTTAPPGWPPVKRNEAGLSRFVYGYMVDTLRRVSTHVTIGSAARKGKDMHSYFLLCQEA